MMFIAPLPGRRRTFTALALVSLTMLLGGRAVDAAPVQLTINNGITGTGFGYTDLHDGNATAMTFGGVEYFASGVILSNPMTGTLLADLSSSGTVTTLSGITGTLAGTGGVTISVTGGSLTQDTASLTPYATGSLFTLISWNGGANSRTEEFWFAPVNFTATPGPNRLSSTSLYLWGNNWVNGVDPTPAVGNVGTLNSNRLGLDLQASITPVPLPAAAWLLLSGLGGLGAIARRRRARGPQNPVAH